MNINNNSYNHLSSESEEDKIASLKKKIEAKEVEAKQNIRDNYLLQDSTKDSTWDKIQLYVELLRKQAEITQLISRSDLDKVWHRHALDCAQLLDCFRENDTTVFDLGSGNGFPGMLLAILRPNLKVQLCDSQKSKCDFLQNVSRETFCKNIDIIHYHLSIAEGPISNKELSQAGINKADVVIARAFGSIEKCFISCKGIAKNKGQIILQRGKNWKDEWCKAKLHVYNKTSVEIKSNHSKYSVENIGTIKKNKKIKGWINWAYKESITSNESVILLANNLQQSTNSDKFNKLL